MTTITINIDPNVSYYDYLKQLAEALRCANMPAGAWINYEFIVRNGKEYEGVDLPTRFDQMSMKQCFRNTKTLVARYRSLTYVEGVVSLKTARHVPLHHAWAIDKDGNVVDVTIDTPTQFYYCGVKINKHLLDNYFASHGFGVFDTGSGLNYDLFFEADPEITKLMPESIVSYVRSRQKRVFSKNNRA